MNPETHMDKSAATRAIDGNSLTRIFMEAEEALRGFLTRYLNNKDDIDDALYEAYANTYRAMESQSLDSPRAYLFVAARNIALNQLNKYANRVETSFADAELDEVAGDEPSAEEQLIEQQRQALMREAIELLPRQCRQVFMLRKQHHCSHRSIAEQLGISVRTVERHIANAVLRCSAYIQQSALTPACEPDSQVRQGQPQRLQSQSGKHRWS